MGSLHDRLLELYPEKGQQPSNSWIPKRQHSLDPVEKFRKNLAEEETQRIAFEEEANELVSLMEEAIEEIFACVEDRFEIALGQGPALDNRLLNFAKSWKFHFEAEGPMLVWAIGEMTEEMNFINDTGQIKMDRVKQKMKEIEKRTKH